MALSRESARTLKEVLDTKQDTSVLLLLPENNCFTANAIVAVGEEEIVCNGTLHVPRFGKSILASTVIPLSEIRLAGIQG